MIYRSTVIPVSGRIGQRPVKLQLHVTAFSNNHWSVRARIGKDYGIDLRVARSGATQLEAIFFNGRYPTFHQLELDEPLNLPAFEQVAV